MSGINVQFYNNKSANNVINKDITAIGQPIVCNIFEECNILRPTLLINYTDDLIKANYCYIPKFDRFYYMGTPTIYDGNRLKVDLKSDPLNSFWNSFRGSICQAKRSTNKYNKDIEDTTRTYKPQPIYNPISVGNVQFNPNIDGSYVITIGGK